MSPISYFTAASVLSIGNPRRSMNRILVESNLSPIRSQKRKRLDSCSKSGLRRIKSKLTNTMKVIGSTKKIKFHLKGSYSLLLEKIAEALAPGQSETLLQIVQSDSQDKGTQSLHETINNEMVQYLKRIYDFYVEHRIPFMEQVRLLSMLPRSWEYEKITDIFGASRHTIKEAHKMYDAQQHILKEGNEKDIRQRVDPEKIKHFVNWLFESNSLISGDYQIAIPVC